MTMSLSAPFSFFDIAGLCLGHRRGLRRDDGRWCAGGGQDSGAGDDCHASCSRTCLLRTR